MSFAGILPSMIQFHVTGINAVQFHVTNACKCFSYRNAVTWNWPANGCYSDMEPDHNLPTKKLSLLILLCVVTGVIQTTG